MGAFNLPPLLRQWPAAFSGIGQRINACLRSLTAVENMKGGDGVDVKVTKGNIVIALTNPPVIGGGVTSGGGGGGGGASLRRIPFSFTAAGDVPTATELAAGIVAGYATASTTPRAGVDFLRSDSLNYLVFASGTNNDVFELSFVVSSVTYWAVNVGPNRLY